MATKQPPPQEQIGVGTVEYEGGEPASAGWHRFVFAELVDLGIDDKFGSGDHRGLFILQLDEEYEGDGDLAGTRKEARLYFSLSRGLGAVKSTRGGTDLRKRLQEYRGKKFTDAELQGFLPPNPPLPLWKLVGREGMVMTTIAEAEGSDRSYAKIVTLAPASPSAKADPMTVENYKPFREREQERKKGGGGGSGAGGSKRGGKPPQEPDDPFAAGGGGSTAAGRDDDSELPY
jgi:hypothetical protein